MARRAWTRGNRRTGTLRRHLAAGQPCARLRGAAAGRWLAPRHQGGTQHDAHPQDCAPSPAHPLAPPLSGSNYSCCTFRGSAIAVNAATGQVLWQTFMAPSNGDQPGGWSGAAVWGSSPVVDKARGQVVVSTGDNYE